MSDTNCPHCGADLEIMDLHDSGEYECPECEGEMWVEVELEPIYTASCLEKDHKFRPMQNHPGFKDCEKCGLVRAVEGNSTGQQ